MPFSNLVSRIRTGWAGFWQFGWLNIFAASSGKALTILMMIVLFGCYCFLSFHTNIFVMVMGILAIHGVLLPPVAFDDPSVITTLFNPLLNLGSFVLSFFLYSLSPYVACVAFAISLPRLTFLVLSSTEQFLRALLMQEVAINNVELIFKTTKAFVETILKLVAIGTTLFGIVRPLIYTVL